MVETLFTRYKQAGESARALVLLQNIAFVILKVISIRCPPSIPVDPSRDSHPPSPRKRAGARERRERDCTPSGETRSTVLLERKGRVFNMAEAAHKTRGRGSVWTLKWPGGLLW